METFNIVKDVLTLIIAGAGVVIAGMALHTWRKEFIGKKKIDLACDIVEQVCNVQDIIRKVRHLGYLVKLDTNGSNPFKLKLLIDEGLLDYVAVDVKAPSSRYKEIAGGAADYLPVRKTADTLKASGIKWEMRTTAVPQLKKEDFVTIAKELPELPLYRINRYRVPETYKPEDRERILMTPHTAAELEEIRQAVLPIQPNTVMNL